MILKSPQHKIQVKPLRREETAVYRVGEVGVGEFAQGSPGGWGQGWCPCGWGWVGMCPHHPSGLSKDSGLVPGKRRPQISLKRMRCSGDDLVTSKERDWASQGWRQGRGQSEDWCWPGQKWLCSGQMGPVPPLSLKCPPPGIPRVQNQVN